MRDNGTMSRKPKAKPQTEEQEETRPAPISCPIERPADPGAELSTDEEEAFALLLSIAESNQSEEDAKRKPPPKSRVEFSRLAVRARGVRFLLDYFAGVPPSKSLRALGLSWGDLTICRLSSPDFDRVYHFCRYQMGERLQDKALQAIEEALDGRDIGSAAASSARFILERLARGDYADPRYKLLKGQQAAGGSGGGIAYQINIINTAAPVTAPAEAVKIGQTSAPCGRSLCGECVDIPAEAVKIGGK